ncbi:hypothetical protein [Luteococcus sp. OSA5]|uniref:hypothetical protein n=1 Tax=Luteococcus sp. OSA5 TaxID=3401630 RepID=UPI003B430086
MNQSRSRTNLYVLAATIGLAMLALSGCGAGEPEAPPEPSSAVATSLPGLTAASGDPTPTSMMTVRPAAGSVQQAPGPFDDRFELKDLRLTKTQVSGSVTVTSDISELLELQVVAGFHDASGRLLGTERFTHHLDGTHAHGEGESEPPVTPGVEHYHSEEFTITVPQELRGKVVSASVAVPVLVNE